MRNYRFLSIFLSLLLSLSLFSNGLVMAAVTEAPTSPDITWEEAPDMDGGEETPDMGGGEEHYPVTLR